jgi:hypothetical protein
VTLPLATKWRNALHANSKTAHRATNWQRKATQGPAGWLASTAAQVRAPLTTRRPA